MISHTVITSQYQRSHQSHQLFSFGIKGTFEGRLRYVSSDAAFTPFFALTEHDRGKLSYLADVDLTGAGVRDLPTGLPVEVFFEVGATK